MCAVAVASTIAEATNEYAIFYAVFCVQEMSASGECTCSPDTLEDALLALGAQLRANPEWVAAAAAASVENVLAQAAETRGSPVLPEREGLLARGVHPLPPVAGTTFVHSQAVTGMGYNASFTGGTDDESLLR
jgi:hypothetical protein